MGLETIVIRGVDVELLEKQRLALLTIERKDLAPEQYAAIEGIQNMLDVWSDERRYGTPSVCLDPDHDPMRDCTCGCCLETAVCSAWEAHA